MTRTKNTIFNIIYSVINKVINIISPFLIRTLMIYYFGVKYLGINSLFASILQILNTAELGFSTAVVFSLYKPMAENDEKEICSILNFYRKMYRIIGLFVLLVGITIIPLLPKLINDDIPSNINIYIIYAIYLINTVCSYCFFSYKSSVFIASQNNRIISNVNTFIFIFQTILQVVIIVFYKNYYLYLIMMPLFTLFNNLFIGYLSNKKFPNYNPRGKISNESKNIITKKVKGLFISRICTMTRNSLDSIFISTILGLTAVAVYSNYYYIMNSVLGLLSTITIAMTSSVGNSLVLESKEKNYLDMRIFDFVFSWIYGVCTIMMLCLYQPFVKIWVGDGISANLGLAISFCLYFYCLNMGSIRAVYHDAAGLWWEARFRAIFETILNLVLNFVLTYKFGMVGTVIGTLIAMFLINFCYGSTIIFDYYFIGFPKKEYYLDHLKYFLSTILVSVPTYFISTLLYKNSIMSLLITGLVVFIIASIGTFFIFSKFSIYSKSKEYFINKMKINRRKVTSNQGSEIPCE
ncbi:MAG: polysaccharide biosynthesis C-terminal domain-containing protein [Methanobacteriaceae archaeon]|nr:polysaccharide biosynthesis C-terminal domain-containing protein [Methanobacteriaceae archaeon]